MNVTTALGMELKGTPQSQLDEAWLALGEHKLTLRRNCLKKHSNLKKVLPELNRINQRITEIWDEMLKRQINSWYYSKPICARTGPEPFWSPNDNFLRWRMLPDVFGGKPWLFFQKN